MTDYSWLSQDTRFIKRVAADAMIRIATITNVEPNDGICWVQYLDGIGGNSQVPVSFPMIGGDGWGIFAMPTVGTMVALAYRPERQPVIVGYVALDYSRYLSQNSSTSTSAGGSPLPRDLQPGEINIHSKAGAEIHMSLAGGLLMMAKDPSHRIHIDNHERAIKTYTNTIVDVSASSSGGLVITQSGELRREALTLAGRGAARNIADTIRSSTVQAPTTINTIGHNTVVSDSSGLVGLVSIEKPISVGAVSEFSTLPAIPNATTVKTDIGATTAKIVITVKTPKAAIDILDDGSVMVSAKSVGIASTKTSIHNTTTNVVSTSDVTVTSPNIKLNGDVAINGNLTVNGNSTVHGTLFTSRIAGDPATSPSVVFSDTVTQVVIPRLQVNQTFASNGPSTINSTLSVGATTVTGTLTVAGLITTVGKAVARIGDSVFVSTAPGTGFIIPVAP